MKNRNQSPVNGWQFRQAQTGWNLVEHVPVAQWDFNLAVQSIIAHRKLNPRFNLPIDQTAVENELDYSNAKRMQSINGADIYIQSDETPSPKTLAPQQVSPLQRLAAGAGALVEWIKSKEEAVPQEQANSRARLCSQGFIDKDGQVAPCPKNGKGDWLSWFAVPAQNAVRKALQERRDWNLTTPYDNDLRVCSSCSCPLPLKVHMPIDRIMAKIPQESFDDLVLECWIRSESK